MRYIFVLLLFFTAGLFINKAAGQVQYEKIKKTFRITYISSQTARDTALVYFPATPASGIELGSSGVVYTTGSGGNYTAEIANGFVSDCSDSGTYVYVVSNIKAQADSNYMVKVGDLITLNIKVPVSSYHSIFYDLETLGISFYKKDNHALASFENLLKKDSKSYADSLVNVCIAEFKKEYDRLSKLDSISPGYTRTIAAGRYKGKSILEIYKNATSKDLLPFLLYAKENPDDYKGQLYYVTYAAAVWMYGNSPYSSLEMLDTLGANLSDPKKFRDKVTEHKQTIIDGSFVNSWVFQAIGEQNKGRAKESERTLKILDGVAHILGDDYSLGLTYACYAEITYNKDDYKKTISYCDSAIKYFKPDVQGFYHAEMWRKKGYCYQALKIFDKSIQAFRQALAVIKDPATDYGYNSRNNNLAKTCESIGDVYQDLDDFTNAIASYKEAVHLYSLDSTYDKKLKLARAQNSLADVYKNQGAYQDAFEIYKELKNTYTQVSDLANTAYTLNNLGYVVFKQGKYEDAITYHRAAEKVYSYLKDFGRSGFSLSQVGQAYWNLGKYDSAILAHNRAIDYEKIDNSYKDLAYSWNQLGDLYKIVGEKNKALNALDSTSFYYMLAKDSAGLIKNLLNVGGVYEKDGQYQKAFDYYRQAHELNLKRDNRSEIANSYFKMAYAAYNYDTALAKKNYLLCYDLAKQIGDKSNVLYSSLNLGILAVRHYDYDLAKKYFDEGLALAIDQKSKTDEAWAYTKIADGATQKLDYDNAIALYTKALNIYDSLGEKSQVPWLYSSIGYSVEGKGDFNGSLRYFEKMKTLGYELKNYAYVAGALSSMSFVYSLFGDHAKALSCADSALQVFRDLNNTWQIANSYEILGTVYSGMGDFQKAITYYLISDSLFRIEKDDLSRSMAQNNIGVVYFFQADYDKSLSYFMESDRLSKIQNTVNESVLVTRQNIGEIYLAKKNYALATKYLMDVNNISREKNVKRMLGGSSLLLGKVAFENDKLQDALKYFKEARENSLITNESDRLIEAELYLGKAYAQLKDEQSLIYLRSSAALAQKTNSKYLWQTLYELGITYYNQNNYDSAIIFFKEAVTNIEESSSKLFGGAEAKKVYTADTRKVDLYNKLVASLAKLKRTDEALFYADKSNSQAIKEKLEQSGIITADKDKSEALKKGNELLQKQTAVEQAIAKEKAKPEKERNDQLIASLEGVKKVAEEDYLNFINELVKKYPDLSSYFAKTDPSQFRNYIDLIPDSTIAILYVINDKQLFIFTVTNQETGIKVVDLPEDLNAAATRFLSILKNPENATGTGAITVRATIRDKNVIKGDFKKDATTLYNLLITPIEDQLKDKKTLCIIPNSKLSSIPFAALGYLDQSNQFHFLVENYRLFYTNKMDIFSKPFKPRNIAQSFAAFGNPDKSLPGATQEVMNIAEILPSATIYLEENATEQKAKESIKNFSFIHFATHGILDYEDFSKSYLLFNADSANDGRLTIAEVNGLIKKENELVFLSACEQAVSKETVKGWYISPVNAFLNNRVKTVVGPLWQVPDEATQILLTEFYKNLYFQKMSATDALRHAQATLSKNPKFSHPYFWGAFVLYGEWR